MLLCSLFVCKYIEMSLIRSGGGTPCLKAGDCALPLFTGRYQAARARRSIAKFIPAIKCAASAIIEANCVPVMHVRGKRMVHPPGTHDLEAVQPETTGILNEVPSSSFFVSQALGGLVNPMVMSREGDAAEGRDQSHFQRNPKLSFGLKYRVLRPAWS